MTDKVAKFLVLFTTIAVMFFIFIFIFATRNPCVIFWNGVIVAYLFGVAYSFLVRYDWLRDFHSQQIYLVLMSFTISVMFYCDILVYGTKNASWKDKLLIYTDSIMLCIHYLSFTIYQTYARDQRRHYLVEVVYM